MKNTIAIIIVLLFGISANASEWTLDSCITYAIEHNITVRSKAIDKLNGEYTVTEAKDGFLPQVAASASQSFSFGRGLTSNNTYANRNTGNFQWGAQLSLPLFQGLSAIRQVDYAKASLRAIVEEYEAAKDDVTLNVMAQYLQVLYYTELHEVAIRQIELSQTELARQEGLLEAGKIPEIDMLNAKSQLAQDELSVVTAENNYKLALVDLAQLLQLQDVESFTISPLSDEPEQLLSATQVYENVMANNHSIIAQREQINAANKYINVAKSGMIPQLSFNAGLGSSYYTVSGYDNQSFGGQMKDNFNTYVGFSLNIPIFDAFSTRNSVRRAKVQYHSAKLQYESAQNNLFKAVQQAYYEAIAAHKKFEASTIAEQSSEQTFLATQEKFNCGRATPTEYETAKTNFLKATSERIEAKYEYLLRTRILNFYNRH
jgi:outer membrane protein